MEIGPQGVQGRQGVPGREGIAGEQGNIGLQGLQGVPGLQGPPGSSIEADFAVRVPSSHGKPRMSFGERVVFVLFLFLLAGGAMVLNGQRDIKQFQREGRERTYESRAVLCRLSIVGGVKFDKGDPCLADEVRTYYDPEAVSAEMTERQAAQTAQERLLCELATAAGVQDPACG